MSSSPRPRRLRATRRGRTELGIDLFWLGNLRREILAERRHSVGLAGRRPEKRARLAHELEAVDDQIRRVRLDLATAFLVEGDSQVGVGSEVTVIDEWGQVTYIIVGQTTADARQGRIPYDSPLARALIGRAVGDDVEVSEPTGTRRLRIVRVRDLPTPGVPARREPISLA